MGRPIKARFFGVPKGTGTGGEGVASLAVNGANSYSAGTTITFADSPIGGTTATATVAFVTPSGGAPGNGNVSSVTLTSAGSGYTTAPAITFNKPGNVSVEFEAIYPSNVFKFDTVEGLYVGMVANAFFTTTTSGSPTRIAGIFTSNSNVIMTNANTSAISSPISFGDVGFSGAITATLIPAVTTANSIQANAWTTTSTMGMQSDIVAQKGSRRYRVTNEDGTSTVRLVPTGQNGVNSPTVAEVTAAGGPVAAGQMTIEATDSDGNTYWVGKLEENTALLFPGGTGTPGTQFTANSHVSWNINAAVASTSVKLATND